jgi:hypothetical protein
MELMPDRRWYVLWGEDHSNAIGCLGRGNRDIVVMDILWGHRKVPAMIWSTVKDIPRRTLDQMIRIREAPVVNRRKTRKQMQSMEAV